MAPPERTPLIEAQGVTVRMGHHELLRSVDLRVTTGEIVSLIGPNGAGKTTLVRVLLGILRPTRGQVRRRPGLVVGYVPQRFGIDPIMPLSVDRFLGLGQGRGLARRGSTERRLQALGEVRALHLRSAAMADLSGGEFQRVVLARALLRGPDLLVLDEPAQGVDIAGQPELYRLIARIRDQHRCGVVLVSHDLHVVMAETDRVVCLNHHVCCSGRPESVTRHPEYLELFGAQAARALAVYTHSHDHRHDLAGAVVDRSSAPPAASDPSPAGAAGAAAHPSPGDPPDAR